MENIKYHLIVCIVNAGFSSEVMDAAKEAGAKGGTIVHARGTANKEAESIYQIVINPEKDVIYIVVKDEIKDEVLTAIYKNAGLNTDAQGIAFSLPVTHAVGLKD